MVAPGACIGTVNSQALADVASETVARSNERSNDLSKLPNMAQDEQSFPRVVAGNFGPHCHLRYAIALHRPTAQRRTSMKVLARLEARPGSLDPDTFKAQLECSAAGRGFKLLYRLSHGFVLVASEMLCRVGEHA
jgi:hypothetical protein